MRRYMVLLLRSLGQFDLTVEPIPPDDLAVDEPKGSEVDAERAYCLPCRTYPLHGSCALLVHAGPNGCGICAHLGCQFQKRQLHGIDLRPLSLSFEKNAADIRSHHGKSGSGAAHQQRSKIGVGMRRKRDVVGGVVDEPLADVSLKCLLRCPVCRSACRALVVRDLDHVNRTAWLTLRVCDTCGVKAAKQSYRNTLEHHGLGGARLPHESRTEENRGDKTCGEVRIYRKVSAKHV